MSGSHYEPDPSQRYSLEDTMHDLPAVTLRSDGHVLSAANIEAAGYRVQRTLPAAEPNCTVWTDTVDRRLGALEAQVKALLARLEDGK